MFRDRQDAAERLARAVVEEGPVDPVVLALPRGGVPLGAVVADALGAPLDLVLVRKIGMPGHSELAAGAIVDGQEPVSIWNEEILHASGLAPEDFSDQIRRKRAEIEARRARYMAGRAPEPVKGRTAIIVDDGIATGATMRVAIKATRLREPAQLWVAVPVAPEDTIRELRSQVDRVICLAMPEPFWAVGAHYRSFPQVPDEEVIALMQGRA